MPHLTSAQEAAFNAAGEAMIDLYAEGVKFTIGALTSSGDKPIRFYAFGDHPIGGQSTVFGGNSETLAGAVQSFFEKHEAAKADALKVTTPKEAIAAAKTAIVDLANENNSRFVDGVLLAERLEAIAVA